MQIENLTIQGFRGIRDKLNFNLSAPLTVILASNGTGKTTICDSVEWLLSGNVERLKNIEEEPLHCKFSDSKTSVEAVLKTGGATSICLKRELNGKASNLSRKIDDGKFKVAKDQELLSTLVPDVNIGRSSQNNMSSWLRATRFLESDSLNLLVDSDSNSHDTRKLMFSNLFGVRSYLEKEKHLSKIKDSLGSEANLNKELKKVGNDISQRLKRIDELKSEGSKPFFEMASGYLTRISELLRVKNYSANVATVDGSFKELRILFAALVKDTQDRKKAFAYIDTNFESYIKGKSDLSALAKDLRLFQEENSKNNKLKATQIKEIEGSRRQLDITDYELQGLLEIQKWVVKNRKVLFALAEKLKKGFDEQKLPYQVKSLSKQSDINKTQILQLDEVIESIQSCADEIDSWLKLSLNADLIKDELKNLNETASERKPKVTFVKQLTDLRARLKDTSNEREQAIQDLNVVLTAGHDHVRKTDSAQCPLCAHEYSSSQELLKIIETKLKGLSSQSKEEAKINSSIKKIETQQKSYENILKKISKQQDELKETQKMIDHANKTLIQIGMVGPTPLSVDGIEGRINERLRAESNKLRDLEKLRSKIDDLIQVTVQMENLLDEYSELLREWQVEIKAIYLSVNSIEKWQQIDETFNAGLEERIQKVRAKQRELKTNLDSAQKQLDNLERKVATGNQQVKLQEQAIGTLTSHQRQFEERWNFLTELAITSKSLKEINSLISAETGSLEELRNLFDETQKTIEKALELRRSENLVAKFKEEVESLFIEKKRIERVIVYHKDLAKGIEALQREMNQFIKQQIEPLEDTISSLYLRSQGNQVVSSITALTNDEGILDWIPELSAEGEKLDNTASLSQGQRQDLALAIFLARARKLGGTFFLDEPLVHLDDLNRIALLDTIRVILAEKTANPLKLVITTSSHNLVRHLREKFSLTTPKEEIPMRIYHLKGSPKTGNKLNTEELKLINNESFFKLFNSRMSR